MAKLVLFHKPYGVLSQFTDGENRATLKDYIPITGVYPAGRLDKDSEGLLLLTDDGQLQHRLAHPSKKTGKVYWAQVEGEITLSACERLACGVTLKDGLTRAGQCKQIDPPSGLQARHPPIRERKSVADSWCALTIYEGRNRQVRRMCAAVGFPVLRLIRYQVGNYKLDGLKQGEFRVIENA